MTIFVYLILPEVSSGAGILLFSGVFVAQIAMDIYYTPIPYYFGSHNQKCSCLLRQQKGYHRTYNDLQTSPLASFTFQHIHSVRSKAEIIIENKIVKVLAFLLQLMGIFGFSALWSELSKDTKYKSFWPTIGFPIIIIMLSIIWTDSFQEYIAQPRQYKEEHAHDSKAKGCTTVKKPNDDQEQSEVDFISARFKSSKYNNKSLPCVPKIL